MATCTAWPPMTMNGIHNGSVSSGSSSSRARTRATIAAKRHPSTAIPMVASSTADTTSNDRGTLKKSASAGSRTASQSTSSSAAARALPAKIAAGAAGVSSMASSEACSRSAANARPNATRPANTRVIHSTPGAMAGAVRESNWKPKFAMTRARTMNCASAGTSSRVRHSEARSLRATASATERDRIY